MYKAIYERETKEGRIVQKEKQKGLQWKIGLKLKELSSLKRETKKRKNDPIV